MGNFDGRLPGPPPLHITTTVHDRYVEAELVGELDLATAPVLLATFQPQATARPVQVVMDLRRLEFMDGAGLSALLLITQRVSSAGGQVALRRPGRLVRRLFDICNVAGVPGITIETSRRPAAHSRSGTNGSPSHRRDR